MEFEKESSIDELKCLQMQSPEAQVPLPSPTLFSDEDDVSSSTMTELSSSWMREQELVDLFVDNLPHDDSSVDQDIVDSGFRGGTSQDTSAAGWKWNQLMEMSPRLDLKQVLVGCAQAISEGDMSTAEGTMQVLGNMVSVSGEPIQRLGAYMLEGLRARLDLSGYKIYKALKCDEPVAVSSDLMSYTGILHHICPYWKFGYMSANFVIAEAVWSEPRIHIIDFRIVQGSQWITLIQRLAKQPGGPPAIRITGIAGAQSYFARGGGLNLVGQKLSMVAASFNVPFEFHNAAMSACEVEREHLSIQPGEAVVVNFPNVLHCLPDESVTTANHRDRLLRLVNSLSPKVVTIVEQESNTNTIPFFQRFLETLDYYTAMFESIDAASPRDDKTRINAEQHCVARDIISMIACEGPERVERPELLAKWRSRLKMAGFTPYPLGPSVIKIAQGLLKNYDENYGVQEHNGALYLGWKNRCMATFSAWSGNGLFGRDPVQSMKVFLESAQSSSGSEAEKKDATSKLEEGSVDRLKPVQMPSPEAQKRLPSPLMAQRSSQLKRQRDLDESPVDIETEGSVDRLKSLQLQSPKAQQLLSSTIPFPDKADVSSSIMTQPLSRLKTRWEQDNSPIDIEAEGSVDRLKSLQMQFSEAQQICQSTTPFPDKSDVPSSVMTQPSSTLKRQRKLDSSPIDIETEGFVDEFKPLEVQSSEAEQVLPSTTPFCDKGDVSSSIMAQPSSKMQKELENLPIDTFRFIPLPGSCCLTSLSESKSTTDLKKLKISNCSVHDIWFHLKGDHCFEYLEFDSCSFPSSTSLHIPIVLKELKITNCLVTECVFTSLMDPKVSVESLEIDSCSSLDSISIDNIPASLRRLRIVNCMNLKSLSESIFKTSKHHSVSLGPLDYSNLSKIDSIGTLELRKLVIQNCLELEYLPEDLHKLCNLDVLSIKNCCSLEYFPEGGLPKTCLRSLKISECENLKRLPNQLEEVTSLQKLSICGCPSLVSFPGGGLPPNLVSLRIINCENFIPALSQWDLDKLEHLKLYSFIGGCPDS